MSGTVSGQDWRVRPAYAWLVFALTFGLLLSDYMSRQVMVAVFPSLKVDWTLSDTQLGSLVSVVAMMVGVLTFPLSVIADRVGRVRSIVLMVLLWSIATAACGLAASYKQMLLARLSLGFGEAAYGSVGAAVLFSIFPSRMRGTVNGTFMAGGVFGSVLGTALGGVIAAKLGWRAAFIGMGGFGLALGVLYMMLVSERRLHAAPPPAGARPGIVAVLDIRPFLKTLLSAPTALFAFLGSGLQLFITTAIIAWLPSLLQRAYHYDSPKAASVGAIFLLAAAVGMIVCGIVCDRLSRLQPARKGLITAGFCATAALLLVLGFRLPPGQAQLALVMAGMVFVGGSNGPAGALVADVTPFRYHASAVAILTLANNLLGIAPGPLVTGMLADRFGIETALAVVPWVGCLSAWAFWQSARHYARDTATACRVLHAAT
jgi:MFS family permease